MTLPHTTAPTTADLLRASARGRPAKPATAAPKPAVVRPCGSLPVVEITEREHEVAERAVAALVASTDLYHRGGSLVRVVRLDEDSTDTVGRRTGSPIIQLLPEPSLREEMTRYARFVGAKGAPLHPPAWLVRAVHWRGTWPTLRDLTGIVETPTIRPDGSPLSRAGYDRATGMLYTPGLEFPTLPAILTRDDAVRAIDFLLDLVYDFPFADSTHRIAWVAGLLTLIGRPSIEGPTPLLLLDASLHPGRPAPRRPPALRLLRGVVRRDPSADLLGDDDRPAREPRGRAVGRLGHRGLGNFALRVGGAAGPLRAEADLGGACDPERGERRTPRIA